jgi:hypothetical protein
MPGTRGKVRTEQVRTERGPGTELIPLEGGFLVPQHIRAEAELPDGTTVHVEIEVSAMGNRARPRTVCVTTDRRAGVGWATLSRIPVRDIVATACLDTLRRMQPMGNGETIIVAPLGSEDPERVRTVVQRLVGYKPKTDDFERVPR